jgi:hypothetical protein
MLFACKASAAPVLVKDSLSSTTTTTLTVCSSWRGRPRIDWGDDDDKLLAISDKGGGCILVVVLHLVFSMFLLILVNHVYLVCKVWHEGYLQIVCMINFLPWRRIRKNENSIICSHPRTTSSSSTTFVDSAPPPAAVVHVDVVARAQVSQQHCYCMNSAIGPIGRCTVVRSISCVFVCHVLLYQFPHKPRRRAVQECFLSGSMMTQEALVNRL